MSYAMVHKGDLRDAIRWYDTEKGARIGTRAANRNAGENAYLYLHEDDYHQRKVKVTSLMSGKEVEIAKTARGTACDPSTERYWSM